MSSFKPPKVPFSGLFVNDYRDEGKFIHLDPVLQPVILLGSDGRLMRPGMIEDEAINHAGNVASADFPVAFEDGQVWLIDHFGVRNNSGAAAFLSGQIANVAGVPLEVGGAGLVQLQNLMSVELLTHPVMIDEIVNTQVLVGNAADNVSVHARRIA